MLSFGVNSLEQSSYIAQCHVWQAQRTLQTIIYESPEIRTKRCGLKRLHYRVLEIVLKKRSFCNSITQAKQKKKHIFLQISA